MKPEAGVVDPGGRGCWPNYVVLNRSVIVGLAIQPCKDVVLGSKVVALHSVFVQEVAERKLTIAAFGFRHVFIASSVWIAYPEGGTPGRMEFLQSERIRIGVDLTLGGAISYLDDPARGVNLVNNYNPTRQIQAWYRGYPAGPRGTRQACTPKSVKRTRFCPRLTHPGPTRPRGTR